MMNKLSFTPALKKINVLVLMVAILFASCSTNEDTFNQILPDTQRNIAIDLSDFQEQFPGYYDLLDFDGYQVADLVVGENGIKKTVRMPMIPLVNNGNVIGYVGEYEGSTFYSENQVTRLINTDLKSGHAISYPIIMVDGVPTLDFENLSVVSYEVNPVNDLTDKGYATWICNTALGVCVAGCTTVVVAGTAVATGASVAATAGTTTPAVLVGAGAAQTACVAACVAAHQACLAK